MTASRLDRQSIRIRKRGGAHESSSESAAYRSPSSARSSSARVHRESSRRIRGETCWVRGGRSSSEAAWVEEASCLGPRREISSRASTEAAPASPAVPAVGVKRTTCVVCGKALPPLAITHRDPHCSRICARKALGQFDPFSVEREPVAAVESEACEIGESEAVA